MQKFLMGFSDSPAEATLDEVLHAKLAEIVEGYEKKHHQGEEDANGFARQSTISPGWDQATKSISLVQFQDLLNQVNAESKVALDL